MQQTTVKLSYQKTRIIVKRSKEEIVITDEISNYSLLLRSEYILPLHQVVFHNNNYSKPIPITARDFNEYYENMKCLDLDPKLQYIEVGAGLGGFIPLIIKKFGDRLEHKPVVIDLADYELMKRLLIFAKREKQYLAFSSLLESRIEELISRINIFLSENVRLYNNDICKVVSQHPELLQTADIVIDHLGAVSYSQSLSKSKTEIIECEQKLLKQNGRLIII